MRDKKADDMVWDFAKMWLEADEQSTEESVIDDLSNAIQDAIDEWAAENLPQEETK